MACATFRRSCTNGRHDSAGTFLDDGVHVGHRNHIVPDGAVNLAELLTELIECGLEVRACGMALDGCAIDKSFMIDGIERGSMKALAVWVKDSDQVMVF